MNQHQESNGSPAGFKLVPVIVVALDTCSPEEYTATGALVDGKAFLVHYPLRSKSDGSHVEAESDGNAVDFSHLILPDGSEVPISGYQDKPIEVTTEGYVGTPIEGAVGYRAGEDLIVVGEDRFLWNASFKAYIAIDGLPKPLLNGMAT
jgi:hypothetical protein